MLQPRFHALLNDKPATVYHHRISDSKTETLR
jgi:hypothetical protein